MYYTCPFMTWNKAVFLPRFKELLSFSSALNCIISRLKDLLTCYIYSYTLVFYVWEYSWMMNTEISCCGESHCNALQLVQ